MSHLPQLPVIVSFLVAFAASFSRIFAKSKPFWSFFPSWVQVIFPQLALAVGVLADGLAGGVKDWTDLVVVVVAAAALLVPGVPSNRSSEPLPGKKAGDVPNVGAGVLFLLACFASGFATSCALFSPADYAHCLPSPADLLADVAQILKSPDYEKKLADLGIVKTEAVVICAVQQLVDLLVGKVGASPEEAEAAARGKAFLAAKGVK